MQRSKKYKREPELLFKKKESGHLFFSSLWKALKYNLCNPSIRVNSLALSFPKKSWLIYFPLTSTQGWTSGGTKKTQNTAGVPWFLERPQIKVTADNFPSTDIIWLWTSLVHQTQARSEYRSKHFTRATRDASRVVWSVTKMVLWEKHTGLQGCRFCWKQREGEWQNISEACLAKVLRPTMRITTCTYLAKVLTFHLH